eukprot:TRINITY_DN5294_c0_g1_i1.p1 TRINITY_DN5294_c0_g1~~TRINITY_DN5294_c0_g1_i1.p1  ORF type:complete len:540 (+),score=113.66 TRINITY_DN5294_c0_g1_i1:22-1620(+)
MSESTLTQDIETKMNGLDLNTDFIDHHSRHTQLPEHIGEEISGDEAGVGEGGNGNYFSDFLSALRFQRDNLSTYVAPYVPIVMTDEFKGLFESEEVTLEMLLFSHSSELEELYDDNHGGVTQFLCREENIKKLIHVLAGDFDEFVLEKPSYYRQLLEGFAFHVLSESRNYSAMSVILQSDDLMHMLLEVFYRDEPEMEWFDCFQAITTKPYDSTQIVVGYLERTNQAQKFMERLIDIGNTDHGYAQLLKFVNNFEMEWSKILSAFDFPMVILKSLPDVNYEMKNKLETLALVVMMKENSPLADAFNKQECIDLLEESIFQESPEEIAKCYLNILDMLLPVQYEAHPIIQGILIPERLELWKNQLSNPTLQITTESLGLYRLKIVEVLNKVISTANANMMTSVYNSGIIETLLSLFFKHENNNILHQQVLSITYHLIRICIEDGGIEQLINILVKESVLLKIVDAVKRNTPQTGYLVMLCVQLADLAHYLADIHNWLNSMDEWDIFYNDYVEVKRQSYRPLTDLSSLRGSYVM